MKKPKAKKAAKARKTTHRSLKSAMKAVKRGGRPPETRRIDQIKIGKRHRKDYGDVGALARSIEARGALLQPIVITDKNELIAGERRIRAWKMTRFALEPIPVHVVSIDAIIAGEYDENAERKDFTLSEAVAIKTEIQKELSKLAKANVAAGKKAAPGQKVGRAGDKAAKFTGKGRRTLEKAEEIVAAAKQDPERFGPLKEAMDKTGRADGPHKRLRVIKQTEAIRNAPPQMPMNGPYGTALVDFPVPAEIEKDQASIDKAGRSFRGYPEMSIDECCKFARDKILPILAADCSVWLTFPNHHIIRADKPRTITPAAFEIVAAFGADFTASALLSWEKDKLGRGQVLRDQTEHAILITRGKPVINVFGKDPPTTWLKAKRRANSQKPDELYDLVERVTPAKRYAEIFSRGGRGELWDCHGDEVGKYAPMVTPPKPVEPVAPVRELSDDEKILAVLRAIDKGKPFDGAGLPKGALKGLTEKSQGKSANKGKLRTRLSFEGRERMKELDEMLTDRMQLATLSALANVDSGMLPDAKVTEELRASRFLTGTKKVRLTARGKSLYSFLQNKAEERAILASFPDKTEERAALYREKLELRHAAALARDKAAFKEVDRIIGFLEDREGCGCDVKLQALAAAPIGQVPCWGQRGMWLTSHGDIPVIVLVEDQGNEITAFAVDPDKPFFDADGDGYIGWYMDPPLGQTVEQAIAKLLKDAFAQKPTQTIRDKKKKGTAEKRPPGPPKPAQVYQLPEAWSKSLFTVEPKKVTAKAAREALAQAKVAAMADPKSGLVKVDETHHVAPGFVTSEEAAKLIGKAELERAPREDCHHPDVVAYAEANGHTVAMTIDQEGWGVGTCACEKPGAHWRFPRNETRNMDAAIDAHWRAQMIAAGLTPPEEDQLEIPGFLDRRNDKPAGATPAAEAAE